MQVRSNTEHDILIYDDGSSPEIRFDTKYKNLHFLKNNVNKGKGFTLFKGFKYALENAYTHVITMDGDLQHSASDINAFLETDSNIDFLFGSRKLSSPMPIHRIISNKITSFIISVFINKKINDTQCGYRRYKLSSLNLTNISNNGYLYETELILSSCTSDKLIQNINIDTIYENSPSNINNFKETYRFINLIFRYIFA